MSEVGVGALGGLIAVYLFVRMARRAGGEIEWYGGALLIACGVYVAFGLVLGGRPLGFELAQLGVFVGIVMAARRYSPMILAGGWVLHAVWDGVHMHPQMSEHAPTWYVYACLAFDLGLAGYIYYRRESFDDTESDPVQALKTSTND